MEFRRGRGGEAQRASRGEQAEGSKPSACSVSSWKRRRETHKDTAISRLMATKLNGTKQMRTKQTDRPQPARGKALPASRARSIRHPEGAADGDQRAT